MKNIPEIRIKGFEGEWKEIKLGEVGTTISGVGFPNKEQGGKHGIPFYKVSDMNNKGNETMMINANNYVTKQQIEKYHWKVCEDVPAIFFAKVGAAIFFDRKRLVTTPCLFDNNTMVYCLDKEFWDATFCLKLFEHIKLSSLSQVGSLPSFNGTAVESISVLIPSKAEQQSLGSFFSSFDRLLSDHHRRLENLRRVKKSMLQKMFPQQGQTVPEIRFKGFSGEWEKAKLSDIANFSKGRGYSKNDLTTKGNGKPIILYGRMYTNYEFVINNVDTYARPLPNSVYSTGKEVIVPASGETAEDISIASAVIAKGIILGGDLNIILPYDDILYPPFLALYITNSNVHYELSLKAQGKTIVHLHNDALEDLEILVPPISEQQRLSSFFTSLDNLINDEVNYIDQLTRVKSTLLQKMFV